jgi:membrane protein required for colicin V production
MNWADWAIIGIFSLSCLIGLIRGFVREALSLLIWITAVLVAKIFGGRFETLLVDYIDTPSVRAVTAFAILFVATLLLGAIISYLIGALVRATGLSGTDRLLGMVFGAARAFVIVMALLILLPGLIPVTEDSWWHQSYLTPLFLNCQDWVLATYDDVSRLFSALFSAAEHKESI